MNLITGVIWETVQKAMDKRKSNPFLSLALTILALPLCFSNASATLHDRGYGFIYDDVLDVTWYDYTFQGATWAEALSWAANLTLAFPETGFVYSDWRLPTTPDSPYQAPHVWGTSGLLGDGSDPLGISHDWGYNLADGELGHLFYEELGNPGGYNTDGSIPSEWGLLNPGPFVNLTNEAYWTATTYRNYPMSAWLFNFYNGCRKIFMKSGMAKAIALHDGDISIPNYPPIITPISNQVLEAGVLFELVVEVYDPDPDNTIYLAAYNLPADAFFDPEAGVFSWIPELGSEGNYLDIEIHAWDDGSPAASSNEFFTITVGADTNRPPEFISQVSNKTITEYETIEFSVNAIDPDGNPLVYEAIIPPGSHFDAERGLFNWTPTASQRGYHQLTFIAADSTEPLLMDQLNITISVQRIPSPEELADALLRRIDDCQLPPDVSAGYVDCLNKAIKHLWQNSNSNPAIKNLADLTGRIANDISGGVLSPAKGFLLLNMTDELISQLLPARKGH